MRLANPQLLWLALALPAVVLGYVLAFTHRRRLLRRLGGTILGERMAASVSMGRKIVRAGLATLALALLLLAAARPQAGGRARLERQRGLDLVVALDFSKSMLARDVYPSRLERAKRELERLMDRLAGDRIGLVAFAGETLTYPPTTDYAAVKLFWRDLGPGDMPVGGTAVGRALKASLEQLVLLRQKGGATRSQVILLLTDGEDTESEPLEVADEAAKLGVKIYAVGIGSRSGELVPEVDAEGKVTGYLKDADGKYVTSRLAEELLGQLAQKTGGEYLRADAKRFGVEQVEQALMSLKRTEDEARLVKTYDEIYEALVLPAFLLLVGEACMSERRKRRAEGRDARDARDPRTEGSP
jgi:Ca-activated chloride channel family protein